VHLGQPGQRGSQPTRRGELADLEAVQLHRGDVGEELDQPFLDDLETGERLAELLAALG